MIVDTSNPAVRQPLGPDPSRGLRKVPQLAVMESEHQVAGIQGAVSMTSGKPCASAAYTTQSRTVEMYETIARSSQPEPVVRSIDASGGRDLMVKRLFGGQEPKVFDGSKGLTMEDACRSNYVYLTRQDRELFSDIYAYADAHDIDPTHIDWIASDLGDYRRHDNGRLMSNFNDGGCYDLNGRQLSVDFNPKDAATAARLLSGPAIVSTRFDQGFLKYILNPGYGALGHAGQFEVLEHVVNCFSAEAGNTSPPDYRFSRCIAPSMGDNWIITASDEVRIQNFKFHLSGEHDLSMLEDNDQQSGNIDANPTAVLVRSLFAVMRLTDSIELLRRQDESGRLSMAEGVPRKLFWKK